MIGASQSPISNLGLRWALQIVSALMRHFFNDLLAPSARRSGKAAGSKCSRQNTLTPKVSGATRFR